MIIKDHFVLQEIDDEYIVVPVGSESEHLNGIIKLNETGAFLWKMMLHQSVSEKELASALAYQYEVDIKKAHEDTDVFLKIIDSFGCIEQDNNSLP